MCRRFTLIRSPIRLVRFIFILTLLSDNKMQYQVSLQTQWYMPCVATDLNAQRTASVIITLTRTVFETEQHHIGNSNVAKVRTATIRGMKLWVIQQLWLLGFEQGCPIQSQKNRRLSSWAMKSSEWYDSQYEFSVENETFLRSSIEQFSVFYSGMGSGALVNKDKFPNTVNMGGTVRDLIAATISLFRLHNWHHATILLDAEGRTPLYANALAEFTKFALEECGRNLDFESFPIFPSRNSSIIQALGKAKFRSRGEFQNRVSGPLHLLSHGLSWRSYRLWRLLQNCSLYKSTCGSVVTIHQNLTSSTFSYTRLILFLENWLLTCALNRLKFLCLIKEFHLIYGWRWETTWTMFELLCPMEHQRDRTTY